MRRVRAGYPQNVLHTLCAQECESLRLNPTIFIARIVRRIAVLNLPSTVTHSHLGVRDKQSLRRCAAMVRKGARESAVLLDVKDYVEALQMGVSNSFDDNGLTPVPAKVQEAVQSSAELRVAADRAQGTVWTVQGIR